MDGDEDTSLQQGGHRRSGSHEEQSQHQSPGHGRRERLVDEAQAGGYEPFIGSFPQLRHSATHFYTQNAQLALP